MAKKSVSSTGAKKSYGKGHGGGQVPAASGKGMNPSAQSDHTRMTAPAQQPGRYQQLQSLQPAPQVQGPSPLQGDPIYDMTQDQS